MVAAALVAADLTALVGDGVGLRRVAVLSMVVVVEGLVVAGGLRSRGGEGARKVDMSRGKSEEWFHVGALLALTTGVT